MRIGFTTGSCAAAAAKAATYMLLTGRDKNRISIVTPRGITFDAEIVDIIRTPQCCSCAVIKDGGDDPDVTTGAHVYAEVRIIDNADGTVSILNDAGVTEELSIIIDGGNGVGRVTKPGLDQPVGNAAINHVPREMIEKEVREVCELFDIKGEIYVVISIPEGIEIAKKTFNPRLGIEGGISVLGTSGVVEPMSSQAIIDTIRVELNQRRVMGEKSIVIAPGNYGLDFMKKAYDYDLDKAVKCSNFIGDTIDMARECGFEELLLVGHIGKLVKLSGGIMNTHSRIADRRMELITEAATACGVDVDSAKNILTCVTTEEAVRVLDDIGKRDAVMNEIIGKAMYHLIKRAGDMKIECLMYSNEHGFLAASEGAEGMLK